MPSPTTAVLRTGAKTASPPCPPVAPQPGVSITMPVSGCGCVSSRLDDAKPRAPRLASFAAGSDAQAADENVHEEPRRQQKDQHRAVHTYSRVTRATRTFKQRFGA